MQTAIPDITALNSIYAHARKLVPELQAVVVLHLGDYESMLAWGTKEMPSQYFSMPLGLSELAKLIMQNGHLSELAMERAIAEVEDIVMPFRAKLPTSAQLFTEDTEIVELAHWAGMSDHTEQWQLTTDAVEQLFNRLVALAQGRPASQDDLPTTGHFSATLLVLRERLHHLGFEDVTVQKFNGSAG
jgi:exopolyphosphatase/pppGpp-phosphohydrolase